MIETLNCRFAVPDDPPAGVDIEGMYRERARIALAEELAKFIAEKGPVVTTGITEAITHDPGFFGCRVYTWKMRALPLRGLSERDRTDMRDLLRREEVLI